MINSVHPEISPSYHIKIHLFGIDEKDFVHSNGEKLIDCLWIQKRGGKF